MIIKDNTYKKYAFTLAEVLITITIIGVVSIITIPSIIQKQQDRTTIIRVQKAYNILSQAYLSAIEEYGAPSGWGCIPRSLDNAIKCRDMLFSKINISQKCSDSDSQKNCGVPEKRTYLNGGYATCKTTNSASLQTSDGITFMVCSNDSINENISWVNIDINGDKKPNKYGYDEFSFMLTDTGVVPHNKYSTGCTFQIIKYKNRKYLKDKKCSE